MKVRDLILLLLDKDFDLDVYVSCESMNYPISKDDIIEWDRHGETVLCIEL